MHKINLNLAITSHQKNILVWKWWWMQTYWPKLDDDSSFRSFLVYWMIKNRINQIYSWDYLALANEDLRRLGIKFAVVKFIENARILLFLLHFYRQKLKRFYLFSAFRWKTWKLSKIVKKLILIWHFPQNPIKPINLP